MPVWIPEPAILAFHEELIAEHGGLAGVADKHLLGATLARPQQLLAYGDPPPSLFELAAAYGFGFTRNHCFTDGNKRVALVAIDVFLQLNGYELTAPETEAVDVIRQLAAGEISESELVQWIEQRSIPFAEP